MMISIKNIKKLTRTSVSVLKEQGVSGFGIKVLTKVQRKKRGLSSEQKSKINFVSLVDRKDVMDADWTRYPYKPIRIRHRPPYVFNWVMSPPAGGGGHQNIFRFIEFLDELGHKNNIYLYNNLGRISIPEAKSNVKEYCKAQKLDFYRYTPNNKMVKADAIFATGWETAYPVFNEKTVSRKMYFVQDYEPYFYPMGTNYVLAENTYKFGFYGITAGKFLKEKLSKEYEMRCDSYDFAADTDIYKNFNTTKKRNEIFFYARPVTERRGFDLGIMALEIFHKKKPDYKINLAGWDVSEYYIPFPYVNHKAVSIEELPAIYNRCSAALVISLTNMSLLPPELLACGTIPVVNEGSNNRLVSDNPYIKYTEANPSALADALVRVVEREDAIEYGIKASKSIDVNGWTNSKELFINFIERELNLG